ncbi:PDZ domain-containing protein [Seongchinamella sediminis]|uniref:PDZ domain-containing protein n=1 Tax=Seongchinamella sediminis TaxID=2283635 RepID=A0A3L7DVQ2_9GAMM|nr:PDZ domain-containing protein [Seongchinamella sediminis]RLQ20383.1 PDZ domain-containing protein [Seongchinamella sediminis]
MASHYTSNPGATRFGTRRALVITGSLAALGVWFVLSGQSQVPEVVEPGIKNPIFSHDDAAPKANYPTYAEPGQRLSLAHLRLTGVMESPDPAASIAIIELRAGGQKQLRPGDTIGDLTLMAIEPESVLLSNGQLEAWLPLSDAGSGDAPPLDDNQLRIQLDAAQVNALELKSYRLDGELLGLLVYPGGDSSAFIQSGLQSGDVVIAIDGNKVTADDLLSPLAEDAGPRQQVELTIMRPQDYYDSTLSAP